MSVASIWPGNLCHLRNSFGIKCSYKLLRCQSGFNPGKEVDVRTCNLRLLATKAEGNKQKPRGKNPLNINLNLPDRVVKLCSSGSISKSKLHEPKAVQCYNLQQITEKKIFDWPAVVIVFDIETTGFSKDKARIIEIALRDLSGGKNSTFQTLVNPGQPVRNTHIHGIRSDMVNRPDVPRFKELLPILIQFVKSRRTDGKQVALFAHNGRQFDVPFLNKEFERCSMKVPDDWMFVDTLPISRKLLKPDGTKLPSTKLDELRQYFGIPLIGPAHRAMQDVNTLSYVLQRMTYQLKLTIPELLDEGFRASDPIKAAPEQKAVSSNLKES